MTVPETVEPSRSRAGGRGVPSGGVADTGLTPIGANGATPPRDDEMWDADEATVVGPATVDEPLAGDTEDAPVGELDDSAESTPAPQLTRRGRVRKWDRPPPPHDWRWYVSNVGRILITVGLLMFGFVAYQLWGTAIENAQAQSALEDDFEELLAAATPVEVVDPVSSTTAEESETPAGESDAPTSGDLEPPTSPPPIDDASGGVAGDEPASDPMTDEVVEPEAAAVVIPVEDQNIPLVDEGDALARIEIPSIGVNEIVVAGVEKSDLKRGPGHFPDTPLPGQLGNSAIAGHRTTYGQPFHDVDKLLPGDEIRVTTLTGEYVYRVTGQQIVSPSDYQVVATTDSTVANLTLTSCHPKWTAQQRIVIFSELDEEASSPVGEPVYNYGRDDTGSTDGDTGIANAVATDDRSEAALPGEDLDGADDAVAPGAAGPDSEDPGPATDATTEESSDGTGTATDDNATSADGDATGTLTEPEDGSGTPVETAPSEIGIADAFAEGWFSDPGANLQVGLWGMILALIAISAYLISRLVRRDWVGAMVGILPFVVALYFFFQNVNRLLPPNL